MSGLQLRGSHSMSKKCPLVGLGLLGVHHGLCGWIQIFLANFLYHKSLDLSLMILGIALI